MAAVALVFPDYLQGAVEAGCLSAESAWEWSFEIEVLTHLPFTPRGLEINRTLVLWHWRVENAKRH